MTPIDVDTAAAFARWLKKSTRGPINDTQTHNKNQGDPVHTKGLFRFIAAAALAAVGMTPAIAQQSAIDAQLTRLSGVMDGRNMAQASRDLTGSLRNGQRTDWTIYLVKEVDYRIHGVCDNDCRDLDLILLDERGNEISQDTSTDDIPIVNARPKWTGRFTLRVLMEDCKISPCNYGVRFFAPK